MLDCFFERGKSQFFPGELCYILITILLLSIDLTGLGVFFLIWQYFLKVITVSIVLIIGLYLIAYKPSLGTTPWLLVSKCRIVLSKSTEG